MAISFMSSVVLPTPMAERIGRWLQSFFLTIDQIESGVIRFFTHSHNYLIPVALPRAITKHGKMNPFPS